MARFDLFRQLEQSYQALYPRIWNELGPWPDKAAVRPSRRHCVHDICSNLSSVCNAQSLGIIEPTLADYVAELYIDWLRTEKAREIWSSIFATQSDTWPAGFVEWVEDKLGPVG